MSSSNKGEHLDELEDICSHESCEEEAEHNSLEFDDDYLIMVYEFFFFIWVWY